MTAEDWEAWCDATFDLGEEPPPGLGWDDEEEDADPELAAGEQLAWAAGFARADYITEPTRYPV
jgi:hypothetical protein